MQCVLCGGSKVKLDGSPCDCVQKSLSEILESTQVCLEVPEQYRGIRFDKELVTTAYGEYYVNYLSLLQADVCLLKMRNKNIYISSPVGSSKRIFAYSCMESLCRKGIPVFPLCDLLELKRIMQEIDMGKNTSGLLPMDTDLTTLYTVPYLFVQVPIELSYSVYEAAFAIVDRRVRRGNSTILLSPLGWEYFTEGDKRGIMRSMVGDGSYMTLEVKTFYKPNTQLKKG